MIKRPSVCHPDRADFGKGLCQRCYSKQWLANNPKAKAQARIRYLRRDKRVDKDRDLQRYYGITLAEFEDRARRQEGRCIVCNRLPDWGTLNVDHDHETGKIRGLLCGRCNRSLGLVADNPDTLRRLAVYLEQSK